MSTKLKKNLAPLVKNIYKSQGFIAIFHSVGKKYNDLNDGLSISLDKFQDFIKFFNSEGYEFVTLDEIPNCLHKKRKFVVLTFDDGYEDNYHVFYDYLKPRNLPATFYITTQFSENTIRPWWVLLAEHTIAESAESKGLAERFNIISSLSKVDRYKFIRNKINQLSLAERDKLISCLKPIAGLLTDNHNFISKEQLKRLAGERLITLANHTFSHPALNVLSESELKQEVGECQRYLQSIAPYPIRHFSVPFGTDFEADDDALNKLSVFGFRTIVTGKHGGIRKEHLKKMDKLPRIYIGDDTNLKSLKAYLSGTEAFLMHSKKRFIV